MKEQFIQNKDEKIKNIALNEEVSDKRLRILLKRESKRRLVAALNGIVTFWHFLFVTCFAVLTMISSNWRSTDFNYIMTNSVYEILPREYTKMKFKKEFLLEIYSSIKTHTQDAKYATIVMMSPIRFNFVKIF